MIRSLRSLIVSILALWRGLSQKEVGARAGIPQKKVSLHLKSEDMPADRYARFLAAVEGRPAEVAIVTGCLESLAALSPERRDSEDPALTAEEEDEVEIGVLEVARLARPVLRDAVLRSRAAPPLDIYPRPADLEPARWQAGRLWGELKKLTEDEQMAAVRSDPRYQSWALMEHVCEESVVQASRDLDRAAARAHLAEEIALHVRGPESWRNRVRGYAAGHGANVVRVSGKLKTAEARLEEAKELWHAGSDPDGVLDPGRLLDLEGALRRDQRKFEEALSLLDEARQVSRFPERSLIMKGFTLETMGEYDRAMEALLLAEPLVEGRGDPRMSYMLLFNLAVVYSHLGRYKEAITLLEEVRDLATKLGDEIFLSRVTWLDGRIAAGLGQPGKAKRLLEQARRNFIARDMLYDVALALLEEAALLLDEGRTTEVRSLARELAAVFKSEGVHREALAALRLFQEAAERETATPELTRKVLRYLFRARYDQGLRFES
ncbi:MAG TPA: tetratricopeptide repeat protein [Thermoanaerobaculia bacterium]|nr:tetratricopeptide repeat protein [Thermoanaerobaculia bacterium]